MSTDELQISTRELAPAATAVVPEATTAPRSAGDDEVRAVLEAFRALPAVAMVDVDPRVFLTGPGGQISVRNNHGRLFASRVPELTNTPMECSPDDVIAWARNPLVAGPTAAEARAETAPTTGGWRGRLNSRLLLGALLVIAAVVAYFNFASDEPEGIEFLGDSAALTSAQERVRGRYAVELAPGQTVLTIDGGKLRVATLTDGGVEEVVAELSYRLGRRSADGSLVLVADNGALLVVRPDGSLAFGATMYPRQARARP